MLFFILSYFFPFYSSSSQKNQNFEKIESTPGDMIILDMCTKNHDQMMCGSWDMVRHRDNCYFSFWAIFYPFIPYQPEKSKFWKNEKNAWRYHHFTYVYQKLWSYDVRFLRYAARRTDGETKGWTDRRTDRRKKWYIEVGAPPKKISD